MQKCRASSCQEIALSAGLCGEHFKEWRASLDNRKSAKEIKERIEKKYDLEPRIKNLEDYGN